MKDRLLFILIIGIALMSLADLGATIFHLANFGLEELNPIAVSILVAGGICDLIIFKCGATGVSVGSILYANQLSNIKNGKRRLMIYVTAWIMFLAMSGLTYYWYVYTNMVNNDVQYMMH